MKTKHTTFWSIALTLLTALTLTARAATVTATVDPPDIQLGDTAQLTVTVTGSSEQVDPPSIPGLDVVSVGNTQKISIQGMSMAVSAATTFTLSPEREGNFVIPAFKVGNATSKPITLHVGKGNGSVNASGQPLPPSNTSGAESNSGPVVMPAPGAGPTSNQPSSAPQGDYGWVQMTLPKKELYLGEFVPVEIKAYLRNDVRIELKDLPQFTAEGLTLNALSTKPAQTNETVGNRGYIVLTWHSALTAVKTGDYPIDFKMPIAVTTAPQIPQVNNDDFNSFFQNAFAAMGQRRDVTLRNLPESIKVLPLPQENRPADFSGAIGQFDIEASATPTQVSAGDPITLKLKVTGRGNFDRVSSNLLAADANWKTYSPKNSFEAADSAGYSGTKTFEQPIIPNDASVTAIPSLTFSFFNPETKQYVTRRTAPLAVSVAGSTRVAAAGNSPAVPDVLAPSPTPGAPAAPAPSGPGSDLAMNKIEPGTFFATLQPIYLSPVFLAGQAVPLLALFAGMFMVRRQRRGVDQQRLRANATKQAIGKQIEAIDAAIANHQTGAFFIAARAALQQRFGQLWNMRPETITAADVRARLGNESQRICPVFEMADQVSYSELHLGDADLAQWRQVVMNELTEKS